MPQVVDAVKVPVIAAGGISDARGIAAAFVLGAAGVQIGSAYLHCPESKIIGAASRRAEERARDDGTAVTNVMTGRPARGMVNRVMREIGPISPIAPEFPLAARRARAAARQGRGGGLGRFLADVVGAGGGARPRHAGAGTDAGAGREAQALLRRSA